MTHIYNIAHRGAISLAPENTLAAFSRALDVGADGFELDVQLTKDGVPVVIHDETVNRTTNATGYIKDFSFHDLANLDAGSWFSNEFKYETIPSLKNVLETFCNESIIINIELKNDVFSYLGIEKKVVDLVEKFDILDKVIISSFNYCSLFYTKKINPHVKLGLLYDQNTKNNLFNKNFNFDTLHINKNSIKSEDENFNATKNKIIAWTVNSKTNMKELTNYDIYGIITDYPEILSQLQMYK
ncbi:glycerophosphodiester phosphodiesterase family protein [Natranaerobius trueperi]|uniref:GP-PDE domain-containing protein n=1 Tax=Natranaerobius trueperi TaxID=759412 RepID=A0A226BYU1_9FIRM|nr:glycerophosphodiester phosphodiesterase family protein [Natranaerobius trueperi]OWZ83942.1 hypothetical protein CDO51_06025 [Natranaerobius trueperi]